jgi:predicted O-methyltransferase YrrM
MTRSELVRSVRERLFASGTVVAHADDRSRDLFPVAIGLKEGLALRDWVRKEKALHTLETGLGYAIATLFICEALVDNGPNPRHVAADPYQFNGLPQHKTTYVGVGLQILEEAGVRDVVEFYAEESQIVLPRLLAKDRHFDLAFIDGNHRFESVFLDLIYSGRLLKQRNVVFVDDTQLAGVRKAVGFCITNLGWTIEEKGAEGDNHEWLVLRTGPKDELLRPLSHFIEF